MVYYSKKYANKQKRDREMVIEKAKDLIKHPFFQYFMQLCCKTKDDKYNIKGII